MPAFNPFTPGRRPIAAGAVAAALLGAMAGCGAPEGTGGGGAGLTVPNVELSTERSTAVASAPIPGIVIAMETGPQPSSMAMAPDGSLLAVADKRGVVLWDLAAKAHRATLAGHPALASAVAFDPTGAALATVGYQFEPEFAAVVTLWDVKDGSRIREVAKSPEQINALAFAPDGKTMLLGTESAEDTGVFAVLDVESGAITPAEGELMAPVNRLRLSPDGSRAACSTWMTVNYADRGEVVLFDTAAPAEAARADAPMGRIADITFTPDGATLAVSQQSADAGWKVQLFNAADGTPREILDSATGEASSLAFAPDGSRVALGGPDGSLRLIDLPSGTLHQAPKYHEKEIGFLAFSPDGGTLVSCGLDRRIAVWGVARIVGGEGAAPAAE